MTPKVKRRLLISAVVLAGAIIVLNALAYRHAYAMMHYIRGGARTEKPERLTVGEKVKVLFCGVVLPRPHTTLSPSVLGPSCRAVTIDCANGIRLGAWICQTSSSAPLVILFHGYGAEKSAMIPDAKPLLEMGCSVMLVDFRGSGESSEDYTTVGFCEADDVAAVVRYAKDHLSYSRLILYGGSMGAAAVLRAVACCGVRPDAIIVEAVFDRLLNTVGHRFEAMGLPAFPAAQLLVFWGGLQAGFNGFAHNPADYAAAVRCPILFLHGTDDPRARLADARRVFAAVPGKKQFKEFPGLGHEAAVVRFPKEWKETVREFLRGAEVSFPTP